MVVLEDKSFDSGVEGVAVVVPNSLVVALVKRDLL